MKQPRLWRTSRWTAVILRHFPVSRRAPSRPFSSLKYIAVTRLILFLAKMHALPPIAVQRYDIDLHSFLLSPAACDVSGIPASVINFYQSFAAVFVATCYLSRSAPFNFFAVDISETGLWTYIILSIFFHVVSSLSLVNVHSRWKARFCGVNDLLPHVLLQISIWFICSYDYNFKLLRCIHIRYSVGAFTDRLRAVPLLFWWSVSHIHLHAS